MSQLIQVRTNTTFSLNYKTGKLDPQIELILLVSKPSYSIDTKKSAIIKNVAIDEVRIFTEPAGIAALIGELTALQAPMQSIENLGAAFNTIIKNAPQE